MARKPKKPIPATGPVSDGPPSMLMACLIGVGLTGFIILAATLVVVIASNLKNPGPLRLDQCDYPEKGRIIDEVRSFGMRASPCVDWRFISRREWSDHWGRKRVTIRLKTFTGEADRSTYYCWEFDFTDRHLDSITRDDKVLFGEKKVLTWATLSY